LKISNSGAGGGWRSMEKDGEGWRRSIGPICEKIYVLGRIKDKSYILHTMKKGRLIGLPSKAHYCGKDRRKIEVMGRGGRRYKQPLEI